MPCKLEVTIWRGLKNCVERKYEFKTNEKKIELLREEARKCLTRKEAQKILKRAAKATRKLYESE